MTTKQPRYYFTRIKDDDGDFFGIKDRKTKKQIACTIYWQCSPRAHVVAKRDATLIVAALNAYQPGQEMSARGGKPRYIYGPDSEGCNDLFVVQDTKTGKDLACTIHWGDGEEVEAERAIILITKALNACQPPNKRRA